MSRTLRGTAAIAIVVALGAAIFVARSDVAPAAAGDASVTIVHGIPSVGAVDVCANGSLPLATNVSFGGIATVPVPAGTYDLTVKEYDASSCTGSTLITKNGVKVPANANVSAIAGLNGGSPVIDIMGNDVASIEAGKGRVQVFHAANAGAVDILVNGGPGLSGLQPGASAAADVPAGSYDFSVVAAGTTSPVLLDLPGTPVATGRLLQVFAVGEPNSETDPFQVIVDTIPLAVTQPASAPAPAAPMNVMPSYTG